MEHATPIDPAAGPRSLVLATPPAPAAHALAHFRAKLAFETDPADLAADLAAGVPGLVLVDTRRPEGWAAGHLPGAVNLPHAIIGRATTAHLDPAALHVTYCWGPACNASTRGAAGLAALGFRVKELIGGLSAWQAEGFPVHRPAGSTAPGPEGQGQPVGCAC